MIFFKSDQIYYTFLCILLKYRVIQDKRPIFWEVTLLAIVNNEVNMNMCPILNGYGDTDV
jgi:hypothetical protein